MRKEEKRPLFAGLGVRNPKLISPTIKPVGKTKTDRGAEGL